MSITTYNIYLNSFIDKGLRNGKLVDMSTVKAHTLRLGDREYPYMSWNMGFISGGSSGVEMMALGFLATLIGSHKPEGREVGQGVIYFRALPRWEGDVLRFRYCII